MGFQFWPYAVALQAIITSCLTSPVFTNPSNVTKRDNGYGFNTGVGWTASDSPFLRLDNGIVFSYQTDGNLVVYDSTTNPWTAKWALGVQPTQDCTNNQCVLYFLNDGNFVGVRNDNAFFSSGTNSFNGHATAANQLYFSPSYPYISLYSPDEIIMWWTYEFNAVVAQNETVKTSSGSTVFKPCTLPYEQCRLCSGNCQTPTAWPNQDCPDDCSDGIWRDFYEPDPNPTPDSGAGPPGFHPAPLPQPSQQLDPDDPGSNPGNDPDDDSGDDPGDDPGSDGGDDGGDNGGDGCTRKRGLGRRLCANRG